MIDWNLTGFELLKGFFFTGLQLAHRVLDSNTVHNYAKKGLPNFHLEKLANNLGKLRSWHSL
jgi:hypothetical protein